MAELAGERIPRRYSRDDLIAICEDAVVPVKRWHDRDSAKSQETVGMAWALLRAGADFAVSYEPEDEHDQCVTDEDTIWLTITYPGFGTFDWGGEHERLLVYLPTPERMAESGERDWY